MEDMVLTASCGPKRGGSEMKIRISNVMRLILGSAPVNDKKETRLGNGQHSAVM